jgi:hypothetical protein
MEYRRLGRSGLDLSVISYGNWLTHGDGVDNATAVACVGEALDAGITVFDTADMYADGRAEELLGSALAGIRRESVIVCSKVGLPTSAAPGDRGLSRTRVITNCHGPFAACGRTISTSIRRTGSTRARRLKRRSPRSLSLSMLETLATLAYPNGRQRSCVKASGSPCRPVSSSCQTSPSTLCSGESRKLR